MHRISLRGPWNLALIGDRLEASRKFHAPKGFFVGQTNDGHFDASKENRESLSFLWRTVPDWPIDCLQVNKAMILAESQRSKNELECGFFSWDSEAGVGRTELSGILQPFNEVVLVWCRWPTEWQTKTGRYTPDPSHPIHFDSWLEIQT